MHTEQRLLSAGKLYSDLHKKTSVRPLIITLSQGTTHKPNPTDQAGFGVFESTAAAKWLLERAALLDIRQCDVMEENLSLDTIGNAYFLRTIHIDPGNYKNLYIITNDWHMDRARSIFQYVFSLPDPKQRSGVGSFFGLNNNNAYNLQFVSAASGISDASVLEKRSARERSSLVLFERNTLGRFSSLKDLHAFIFVDHNAYAAARVTKKDYHNAETVDPDVLATY